MSGTGPVEKRIAVALEKIERVIAAPPESNPQEENSSEAETARLHAFKLRRRVKKMQTRLHNAFEQIDFYKEKLAQEQSNHKNELQSIAKNIDEVRGTHVRLEDVHKLLNAEIDAGSVSLDTVNQALKAQLDALHAERSLEQIELAVVQRELQDILATDQAKTPEKPDET